MQNAWLRDLELAWSLRNKKELKQSDSFSSPYAMKPKAIKKKSKKPKTDGAPSDDEGTMQNKNTSEVTLTNDSQKSIDRNDTQHSIKNNEVDGAVDGSLKVSATQEKLRKQINAGSSISPGQRKRKTKKLAEDSVPRQNGTHLSP